jgi:hypothetical protein
MPLIFPIALRHPKTFIAIGHMLTVYGDMETDLTFCVSNVHGLSVAIKALFRPRGETTRVDIADAMAREAYEKVGLGTEFAEAIGNFRFCLRVRNQYAHCNWYDWPDGRFGFVDMQDLAESNKHLMMETLTVYPIDHQLVEAQANYFGYVQESLRYVASAYGKKVGLKPVFELSKPKKVRQPIQHMPGIQPSRPTRVKPSGTPPEGAPPG